MLSRSLSIRGITVELVMDPVQRCSCLTALFYETITCCPQGVGRHEVSSYNLTFRKKCKKAIKTREGPKARPFSAESETWQ